MKETWVEFGENGVFRASPDDQVTVTGPAPSMPFHLSDLKQSVQVFLANSFFESYVRGYLMKNQVNTVIKGVNQANEYAPEASFTAVFKKLNKDPIDLEVNIETLDNLRISKDGLVQADANMNYTFSTSDSNKTLMTLQEQKVGLKFNLVQDKYDFTIGIKSYQYTSLKVLSTAKDLKTTDQ